MLQHGQADTAWDLFLDRYRRLIFASIRNFVSDADDVMDVFAQVLEALREDDFRRIRSYLAEPEHRARFSTWLVTVIRHLTIDWLRARDGRERTPAVAQSLPQLERRILELVFLQRYSHNQAYELVRSRDQPGLAFRDFLVALRAVYQAVGAGFFRDPETELAHSQAASEPPAVSEEEAAGRSRLVQQILASLPEADRVLLQLYVVEGMPAAAVAKVVDLPNAKAVYNRAYRLMEALRPRLRNAGLEPDS
jgi:RNA polymerase sigma factor (sigma-70 family)